MPEKPLCECKEAPFYRNKVVITTFILTALILLSYIFPALAPFRKSLFRYIGMVWWALALGLFIGGIIDYYVPREYISHILARPKKRTIIYSVILGFLMSACSHGILALSIAIHKKGASNPAVVSFLLASPWSNLTFAILILGFFGLKGIFIIVSAIIIAIITGLVFQLLERKGLIEKNENIVSVEEDFSILNDIKKRYKDYKWSLNTFKTDIKGVVSGALTLGNMVLWWILIGMSIASFASAYVPQEIFSNYMGPTILGLIVTLILATIIEICSEGSIPIAFEIFRQTGALGNSLVFLMAGVATDYTEIGLLWHNVGKRVAIWLPIITVPQVIVFGIIANRIF